MRLFQSDVTPNLSNLCHSESLKLRHVKSLKPMSH